MSDWLNVASTDELKPGEVKVVDVDGTDVALFNIADKYFAVEDVCTQTVRKSLPDDSRGCHRMSKTWCSIQIRTGEVTAPRPMSRFTSSRLK
ncbi:MAG: hypothetical protein Ct9H300mP14_01190 [Gammaproteobacteria bacterium]|nr:MAG: hypothetical protein Ct9H300mP14_01190 [Gammaproteobacteria bacterium]